MSSVKEKNMIDDFEISQNDWLDDFGFADDTVTRKHELTETIRVKYKRLIERTAKTFKDIVAVLPAAGEQVNIITDNAFNAISVLAYFYENYKIEEINIAIYRMNLRSVDFIKTLFGDNSLRGIIIFSSFFRENKSYERWVDELLDFKIGNLIVKTAWSHAKVVLVKTDENYFVFEGSGNLSDNARIEQYTLTNDQRLYEFHKRWMISV